MKRKKEEEQTFPNVTGKRHQRLKRKLQNIERVNDDRIYLIPCSGNKGWHEMAENSALIYYYEVIQKKGLKNRFFADTKSFEDRYELGYIRIPNVNDVRVWLKEVDLYKEDERLDDGTWCFELKKRFTEKELKRYRQMELERREALLMVAPAHNLAPEFYQLLLSLGPRLHEACSNQLNYLTRERIGGRVVDLIDEVMEYYHQLTFFQPKETERITEKWKAIRADLYNLLTKVKVLSDYNLLNHNTCVGFCDMIRRLIEISESKLKTRKLTSVNKEKGSNTNGESEKTRSSAEGAEKASTNAN